MKLKCKQAEKIQKNVEQETIAQRTAKEIAEIRHLHNETGGYIGTKEKGTYKIYTLEELTASRPSQNWLAIYTQQNFEDRIRDMQQYKQSGVRQLFAKMCFISDEETVILLQLYNSLKETDAEIAADLEFLMCKAGIKYD